MNEPTYTITNEFKPALEMYAIELRAAVNELHITIHERLPINLS